MSSSRWTEQLDLMIRARTSLIWIRSSEDLAATRIIAMSGRVNDAQAAQLATQGYDATLKKPFSVRQMIDSIEQVNAIVY